jgi:hypothetical protein
MYRIFKRSPLLLLIGLFFNLPSLRAVQLSEYADAGEFRGVFKGIAPGKHRLQGSKKNFQGWLVQSKTGETNVFAILEAEPSVTRVAAYPKAYIGKECVVVWDMVEEVLAGQREPTDLKRIRDVRWGAVKSAQPVKAAAAAQGGPLEATVRSFFNGIENRDLGAVTSHLDDQVQYYQPRPMSRSAVLADIKYDWKRYTGWHGEISEFRSTGQFSGTFKLSYTMQDGAKARAATLQCSVSVNPKRPNAISKITASELKSAPALRPAKPAEQPSVPSGKTQRRFQFHRPEDDAAVAALHTIDISIDDMSVTGTWHLQTEYDGKEVTQPVQFTGQVLAGGTDREMKISVSFKGPEPYFPVSKSIVWSVTTSANLGTTIQVPNYWVYGRTQKPVVWNFREIPRE